MGILKRAKDVLPDTLSGLIRISLKDLKKVERMTRKYRVDMGVWYEIGGKGKPCKVCQAGAVMAMRLNVYKTKDTSAYCYRSRLCNKLVAIDFLRTGDVWGAALHIGLSSGIQDMVYSRFLGLEIVPYRIDRDKFFEQQEKLASDLEAMGL